MIGFSTDHWQLRVAIISALLVLPSLSVAQQGPLDLHPDDGFLCYKGRASRNEVPVPPNLKVELADQFETKRYLVYRERGICNPADQGEGIVDGDTHLTGYKIRLVEGEASHVRQTNIRVFNKFGYQFVDTIKEDSVLLPAAKDEAGGPVVPPNFQSHGLDNYKCYKIRATKGTARFPRGVQTHLSDQFENKLFDVKKPKLLCTPADKDEEGIKYPDGHLMCYKVKPAKGEPKHERRTGVSTADHVVIRHMDTKKEELLCVPSLKNAPDFCGDGVVNQPPFEECDGAVIGNCGVDEVCSGDCTCTLCGNNVIDPGEDCEEHSDCTGQEVCDDSCMCELLPPLGQRAFSLGPQSGFYATFLPGVPIATPAGTLVLDAGSPDELGSVPVNLLAPPYYVTTNVTLGVPETQCWRFTSCTGTLYCSGGANVDTLTEVDSLAESEPMCIRDGTNSCPDDPASVCCSNACEGVGVGSGNDNVITIGVNPTDSGAGAMALTCSVDVLTGLPYLSDCSVQDYSGASTHTLAATTATGTSRTLNHCAGTGAGRKVVPTFVNSGGNFDCESWTTENGPGSLAIPFPSEEPSPLATGDIPTAFILIDASPSGAFLDGATGVLD
jgi:hypothetical protein